MKEIWIDIPGYEGLYQVSNQGRVRNSKRNRLLAPHKVGAGYLQTTLSIRATRSYPLVHRLVAQAFIANPENKPHINHKNGDKTDNRVENLEWCTMSENLYHRHRILGQPGGRCKAVTCISTGETYPSAKATASALGVSKQTVLRICWGHQKATRKLKLKFKFKGD